LIVQQNYFSNLYPTKILDFSAKPFFPCISKTSEILECRRSFKIYSLSIWVSWQSVASYVHAFVHGKNDFAERSKILLDTDLKIISLFKNNKRKIAVKILIF